MNVFVEYKGRKLLVTKQLWDTIDHFFSIPEKSWCPTTTCKWRYTELYIYIFILFIFG